MKALKVGHGGTLDPMATGVLVIGVGEGCKQLTDYLSGSKIYIASGIFGNAFDTYDTTGHIISSRSYDHLTKEKVGEMLKERFLGEIMQRPPPFSAVHVGGERAYKLARAASQAAKETIIDQSLSTIPSMPEIPARPVTIMSNELLSFSPPEFSLRVECGGGTYIRSIIHDLGEALDTVAAMSSLERIKQGPFTVDMCLTVDECADLDKVRAALLSSQAQKAN